MKQKIKQQFLQHYDYTLILLTTLVLAGIGIICLYGITYYNYHYTPRWTSTQSYTEYLQRMNHYTYPLVVLLLITLGMCIPKRILPRDKLLQANILILTATTLLSLHNTLTGITFLLTTMLLLQGALTIHIAIQPAHTHRFEKQGRILQLGSSTLHLGIILLILDLTALQASPQHLTVFWASTTLITTGSILSFYPEHIKKITIKNKLHIEKEQT